MQDGKKERIGQAAAARRCRKNRNMWLPCPEELAEGVRKHAAPRDLFGTMRFLCSGGSCGTEEERRGEQGSGCACLGEP